MILDDEKMTSEDFFILYPRETLEDKLRLLELSEAALKVLLYYIDKDRVFWNEKTDLETLDKTAFKLGTTKRRVSILRYQLRALKLLYWKKSCNSPTRVYPLYDNIHSVLIKGYK